MTEIQENKHGYEVKSEDPYGPFTVKVIRPVYEPYTQLSIDSDTGDCFIDLKKEQLTAIRDMLDKVISEIIEE